MELRARLAEAIPALRASSTPPDKIAYARDLWPRHHLAVRAGRIASHTPAAVAWPETPEQCAELVAWCSAEGVSIVPYGAGSGVCAGVLPTPDMLVVDTKRMRRWRKLDREAGTLDVEVGVLGIRLEEELQPKGYTVGHFPSSILCSTVGGWVAARGAGQCSGRYGKIEDMVAALECIDGSGAIANLRRRTRGPDLTPLIIGSEGILSLITSATLRLHPVAVEKGYAAFSFGSMEQGYEAIRTLYQVGLRPAVCRLYDPFDAMMARRGEAKAQRTSAAQHEGSAGTHKKKSPLAAGMGAAAVRAVLRVPGALNRIIDGLGTRVFGGAMLVLLFEGADGQALSDRDRARAICRTSGGEDLGEGPARHWEQHRYSVSYRQAPMLMMGAFVDTMEVAAPWSKLGGMYDAVREALGPHVMVMAHMSHAYPDGCSIYFTFAGCAADDDACERLYDRAWRAALTAVLDAGGTLSHHHGVGRSKAPKMGEELGLGVEIVRALEDALDPAGIFNPGAVLPSHTPARRPLPPAPEHPQLDGNSHLVRASGSHSLGEVERVVASKGLSLCVDESIDRTATVNQWLAEGAPGGPDPWLDPVDHLVAGYSVELPKGAALNIAPCPRRAVGPDLWALFFGTRGRAGRIHTVHLRARCGAPRPLEVALDRQPPIEEQEQRWIDRAVDTVAALE